MKVIQSIDGYEKFRKTYQSKSIGFVATMGALHDGHLSLVKQSLSDNEITVVSIYVNATQFDNDEDLNKYPNIIDQDLQLLKNAGVDAVFMPDYQQMYPDNYTYKVQENMLSNKFCGAHRNGHFDGVLTVVMKFFNIIQPSKAYFGKKDYQQLTLIKKMAAAFFMPVEVIGSPIIRESDGLAMSSRNLRLTNEQRKKASQLYKTISSSMTIDDMRTHLSQQGFDVDYIEEMDDRLLAAATLGKIRLIDNVNHKKS